MSPLGTDGRTVYLMYHELELPGRALCDSAPGYVRYVVFQDGFEQQMRWIRDQGQRTLSVEESLSGQHGFIVLTFDDGCETDLIAAAPLLKELNFGATFYVTVGFLGKCGYLSRAQLRELSDLGFDIGCHSMTHPHLNDLPADKLPDEIAAPKTELENITGRAVNHFSCPGGRWNTDVIDTARRAGFHSVATSDAHINFDDADPFSLGRVVVMRNTDLATFRSFCRGRGLWKVQLGFAARARIKALLGNSGYDRVRAILLRRATRS